MAEFFERGSTPPGARDGSPFNTSRSRAQALARADQARRAAPHQKFQPDIYAAPKADRIESAPSGTPTDGSNGGKASVKGNMGTATMPARRAPGAFAPPGPRPAAMAARQRGATRPGEYGDVVLGGRPIGSQVGRTGHEAPERPLAMNLGRAAATNLPPLR